MRTLAAACALLPLLAACDSESTPSPQPVPEARLTGTFDVTTRLALPAADAAPGALGDALDVVHGLAVNPGGALLDLAEAAGVPAVAELRLALPSSLEERVEGWIGERLATATVDGTSPLAEIAALDERIRAVLLEWELRSTLELPASGTGRHAPVALVFPGPAGPVEVPVSASAPVTAATGVTATVSWPGGEPRVTVSDHALGVPFGRYALEATRAVLEAAYGTPEPRDVLGQLLDCSALAVSVAARCVGPVCVGHEAELGEICEGGLDEAAARVEARILALDYEAIRLDEGSADAEGAALDLLAGTASATRLSGGVWSAAVDLGEGPVAAQGTFAAAAVP